ncbi:MAG: hypothetical protein JOS17DRAFT_798296 [Linnemannia elongata]|nr:MAG: hypothetical protein JOS17DRAFT_798296 [Linnemannia elongata]
MAAMATSAIVSAALFVGKDTTNYSDSPVEIFKTPGNHAAAAASALVYSAKEVEVSPATQGPKSLIENFNAFVIKVSTFPGFFVDRSEESGIPLNGSLIQLEEVIREGLGDPLIASSFRDLVPGYIQEESLTD